MDWLFSFYTVKKQSVLIEPYKEVSPTGSWMYSGFLLKVYLNFPNIKVDATSHITEK
jgi:hypothetical protein